MAIGSLHGLFWVPPSPVLGCSQTCRRQPPSLGRRLGLALRAWRHRGSAGRRATARCLRLNYTDSRWHWILCLCRPQLPPGSVPTYTHPDQSEIHADPMAHTGTVWRSVRATAAQTGVWTGAALLCAQGRGGAPHRRSPPTRVDPVSMDGGRWRPSRRWGSRWPPFSLLSLPPPLGVSRDRRLSAKGTLWAAPLVPNGPCALLGGADQYELRRRPPWHPFPPLLATATPRQERIQGAGSWSTRGGGGWACRDGSDARVPPAAGRGRWYDPLVECRRHGALGCHAAKRLRRGGPLKRWQRGPCAARGGGRGPRGTSPQVGTAAGTAVGVAGRAVGGRRRPPRRRRRHRASDGKCTRRRPATDRRMVRRRGGGGFGRSAAGGLRGGGWARPTAPPPRVRGANGDWRRARRRPAARARTTRTTGVTSVGGHFLLPACRRTERTVGLWRRRRGRRTGQAQQRAFHGAPPALMRGFYRVWAGAFPLRHSPIRSGGARPLHFALATRGSPVAVWVRGVSPHCRGGGAGKRLAAAQSGGHGRRRGGRSPGALLLFFFATRQRRAAAVRLIPAMAV